MSFHTTIVAIDATHWPHRVFWRELVGAWRFALARRQRLDVDIDEATLRDLGISRAELSSFRAEADGLVDSTRLRVNGPRHLEAW